MSDIVAAHSLDICLLTKNRAAMVCLTLQSIEVALKRLFQQFPHVGLKIGVRIGVPTKTESDAAYARLVRQIVKRLNFPGVQADVLEIEDDLPGANRNRLIQIGHSDWVFFCDDDVVIGADLFSSFFQLINEFPEVEILGGPNLDVQDRCMDLDCSLLTFESESAQSAVLGSSYFTGPVASRYRTQQKTESYANLTGQFWASCALTLCNLFWRRDSEFRFRTSLLCGEELPLIFGKWREAIGESGHRRRWLVSPRLGVQHFRRKDKKQFFSQTLKYGIGRGQVSRVLGVLAGITFLSVIGILILQLNLFLLGVAGYGVYLFLGATWLARPNLRVSTLLTTALILHFGYFLGLVLSTMPISSHRLRRWANL